MLKCPHGNYMSEGLLFSYACTGCRPELDKMLKIRPAIHEQESDEIKQVSCPLCSSREFTYVSEDEDYFCPRCGFDNYTLI
jgi:DNA-directed RNA polymerase subunit RPC12/RpoP